MATSGRRRTRGYEAPVGAYVSGRSESVECRQQPQQIWSIKRQGNEQVPNESDCADTLAEILTVPSAMPVKVTAADAELGMPAGDQFDAVFQSVPGPTQVDWECT